jgi:hypothetical protein
LEGTVELISETHAAFNSVTHANGEGQGVSPALPLRLCIPSSFAPQFAVGKGLGH